MTTLRVQYKALAGLVCAAAVIAAVLAIVPTSQQIFGRILAVLACISFCYVSGCMYLYKKNRLATTWQSLVWSATFLLMVMFLIKACFAEGFL